jgi:hypothetical protein
MSPRLAVHEHPGRGLRAGLRLPRVAERAARRARAPGLVATPRCPPKPFSKLAAVAPGLDIGKGFAGWIFQETDRLRTKYLLLCWCSSATCARKGAHKYTPVRVYVPQCDSSDAVSL